MEYYASSTARLSRICPIFFGSRVDAFGPIGNLFFHDYYRNLPKIKPVASVELAAKLLRENGINLRPHMFDLTVRDIVDNMKRFLCVFAWNIANPTNVISECVNEVLAVVRESLEEKQRADDHKKASIASTPPPISHPEGNPSQARSESLEGEMNHQDAWAIIHNEKYVTDMTAMVRCLQEELGIYDPIHLIGLDKEEVVTISSLLKTVHKKKLLKCSRIN